MSATHSESRKPKILVISNYRSTISVRPEAEIFIGLAMEGFDITIMTYGDAAYEQIFREAGIKVIDFHPEKKFERSSSDFIRKHLLEGAFDILHMFNSKAYANGLRAAKGLPVKVVMYRGTEANMKWYDVGMYTKYYHPRTDRVVCNSRSVEDEFRRQSIRKNTQKFVTINKGHRPEWYHDIPAGDLSAYKTTPDTFVLTCVANARRVKGVKYLLEAMKHVHEDADIALLLVGHGLDTPPFQSLASKSGHGDKIFFTGFRKDAAELVRASDAFIMPSIGAESLTKAVIEAMHMGTAPIITDIAGNKYLVEHGQTGLVVPPKNPTAIAEAVNALLDKRTWCTDMGNSASKSIAKLLHSDRTVEEYAAFYSDLVGPNPAYTTSMRSL